MSLTGMFIIIQFNVPVRTLQSTSNKDTRCRLLKPVI